MRNTLFYGDNLEILRHPSYIPEESVDLVYLDPPFNSNASYNVLFSEKDGSQAASQIKAFDDTWHWHMAAPQFDETVRAGGPVSQALLAFQQLLGTNDMLAYLTMMAPRLVELRRKLKPTGSLYLHCDPTASHYLKVLLDAVFGPTCFRNELIWERSGPKSHAFTRFASAHDVLLAYTKADKPTWNPSYQPYRQEYVDSHYRSVEPETGRHYQLGDCLNPNPDRPNLTYEWNGLTRVWRWTREKMQQHHDAGRLVYTKSGMPRYKRYLDELPGTPTTDVWTDIPPINSQAQERLGYPTQKPEALLERIILASSNEGDVVLDPFCGCGTTVAAAQKLNRRWLGIDVTHIAITLMKARLAKAFGEDLDYCVRGEPTSVADAEALAKQDPHQFQLWALGLVHARPLEVKKGADKGVDGRIPFNQGAVKGKDNWTHAIISVKSGNVHSPFVRDLVGTVEREKAALGVLITLKEPTRDMLNEAASAGFYVLPYDETKKYPRIQILTIRQLLEEHKQIDCAPLHYTGVSYKAAPKADAPTLQLGHDFGGDDE